MKSRILITSLFLFVTMIVFYGFYNSSAQDNKRTMAPQQGATPDLNGWPAASQEAAKDMMAKYGNPDAITGTMLSWKNKGKWEKIAVSREQTKHNWPMPHQDVLDQCVNYKVDVDKLDDIAQFDGSVTVKRTAGLLCAKCDKEAMNILALNLAVEVAKGTKTSSQARDEFAKHAMAYKEGQKPEMTQKLMFDTNANAAEPDSPHNKGKDVPAMKDDREGMQRENK